MRNFWKKIKALFVKSDVEKTALQKTARISIIFACVAVVGVIVYFAAVAPMLKQDETYVPELFEGEIYQNNSIYILKPYDRKDIKSIEISNEKEHYQLNAYTVESGDVLFAIEGSEEIALSEEKVSALLASVRLLITNSPAGQERVNAEATKEDLAHYGLDEASNPSWFEVTLHDDSSYRIYIGNPLVTTTGYYVMLDGRKNVMTDDAGNTVEYDIVYALQSTLSNTVLSGSASLLSNLLLPYIGSDVYNATDFTFSRIEKGDERELLIRVGKVEDVNVSASSKVYEMLYPHSYHINEDAYTNTVLTNLSYVTATEIMAYGDRIHTPEVYEQYGLDLDMDRLLAVEDHSYAVLTFNCMPTDTENYETYVQALYFSEKFTDIDGLDYYYVYSPLYEVIGKVSADVFEFVEWNLAKYTSPYLFFEYFTSTENFAIVNQHENLDIRFTLSGKERDRHVDVTTSDGRIVYQTTANGGQIPLVYDVEFEMKSYGLEYCGEFENFRSLYYVLVTRELALYAEVDENITTTADEDPAATLEITTSPKDHPISYYQYDANGKKGSTALRDEGGNIICHKVVVPTTLSNGTVKELVYEKAFYDPEEGRFFLKQEDANDGNVKPSAFKDGGDGTVKVTTYLPATAYGEYMQTTYFFEFYDLYDEYEDASGNTIKQLNPTYMYVLPSTTFETYRLTSNGERELLETEVEQAEVGVYIRTAMIDKLFSDTHKLLNGEEIDTWDVN